MPYKSSDDTSNIHVDHIFSPRSPNWPLGLFGRPSWPPWTPQHPPWPGSGTWIFKCQVFCVRWHERWASGVSLKRVIKMQFRNDYFRSLVHSSQKLWPKPDSGNFAPCILPCKIGGSQNLMKERYLSKTPFLTFVYLSKCNIKLPGYFGNSKKRFLWIGLIHTNKSAEVGR